MCPNKIGRDERQHPVTRVRRRGERGRGRQQDGLQLPGRRQDGRRHRRRGEGGEGVLERGVPLDAVPAPLAVHDMAEVPVGRVGRVRGADAALGRERRGHPGDRPRRRLLDDGRHRRRRQRAVPEVVRHAVPRPVHPPPVLRHPRVRRPEVEVELLGRHLLPEQHLVLRRQEPHVLLEHLARVLVEVPPREHLHQRRRLGGSEPNEQHRLPLPRGAAEEVRREALLLAVLVDELQRVGKHARRLEPEQVAKVWRPLLPPVSGKPARRPLGDLEEERLRVLPLRRPVGAVVGDGDVRGIHEVLEEDGVVVGELVHRGQVGEPRPRVRLEPRQLPLVRRVGPRHPRPHHALRVPHLVAARARVARDLGAVGELRDLDALALAVELPPVVQALQLAIHELALG